MHSHNFRFVRLTDVFISSFVCLIPRHPPQSYKHKMKVEINIQTQNEKRDLTCQQHLGEWDVPLSEPSCF